MVGLIRYPVTPTGQAGAVMTVARITRDVDSDEPLRRIDVLQVTAAYYPIVDFTLVDNEDTAAVKYSLPRELVHALMVGLETCNQS